MSDNGYYYEDEPAGLEPEDSTTNFSPSHPNNKALFNSNNNHDKLTSANLQRNSGGNPTAAAAAAPQKGDGNRSDTTQQQQQQAAASKVELEIAKRLLQSQITVTVQRYDAHITLLMDNYFGGLMERRLLYNTSRAIAAPLIPFGAGGAEERSATIRFERMLMAGNKAMEVELNSFRKQCFEIQTEWQKQFLTVCSKTHDAEMKRKDDFLNLQTICRKEVDATSAKMRAEYAVKAVELEELVELRRAIEVLTEEASAAREALQEARRVAAEDRTRHFKDRESIINEYSETLQKERQSFADRLRELDGVMEAERSAHLTELTAVAQRHARSMAELHAQLSEAREANSHYISDASCARGEILAEKKAFVDERAVTQRYIRELEAALVEVGGRPDLVPSSRAAAVYLAASTARRDRIMGGGGSMSPSASIMNATSSGVPKNYYHDSMVGASIAAGSPRSAAGAAIRQQNAVGIVDEMLGGRGLSVAAAGPSHSSSLVGAGAGGRSPSSLLPREHHAAISDVSGRPSYLQQLRSPSAEMGGSGYGRPSASAAGRSLFAGSAAAPHHTMGRSRSASPNNNAAYGGGYGGGAPAPYRQPTFASPSTSEAERQRTIRNQGGTARGYTPVSSLASPSGGSGYFSSRR